MSQSISVLGATGSIGVQTLQVARQLGLRVAALAANRSIDLLEQQGREFSPELIAVYDAEAATALRQRLEDTDIRVVSGMEGLVEAALLPGADTVVTAVMGMIGLRPTLAAIDAGKRIALANKETLVCAGKLVMARAAQKQAEIVPVDSEHSAIFQCLQGCRCHGEIRRLVLTASGGPFYGKTGKMLASVTPADALKHPNWTMGAKITVDSATLMNKGLELIEAMRLYSLPPEQIQILIHRQSIIHSLVEFCDHALIAQLGTPDMRLPIQYALTWPNRMPGSGTELDLLSCPELTFAAPDEDTFRCLKLARQAAHRDTTACAVLNGANEVAVALFLRGEIGFLDIPALIEHALNVVPEQEMEHLDAVLAADAAARAAVYSRVKP